MNILIGWSSVAKDVAFCLCCYLFKPDIGEQAGGDFFIMKGSQIGRKRKNSTFMLEAPLVLITRLGKNVKSC